MTGDELTEENAAPLDRQYVQPQLDAGSENSVFREAKVEYSATRGPLPSAEQLAGYGEVDPSIPGEIIAMAKKEQDHRHEMDRIRQADDKEIVQREQENQRNVVARGQWLGLSAVVAVLGLAAWLVSLGYPGIAAVITAVDLAALVTAFIVGGRVRDSQSNDSSGLV